jgi:hypothetical protein
MAATAVEICWDERHLLWQSSYWSLCRDLGLLEMYSNLIHGRKKGYMNRGAGGQRLLKDSHSNVTVKTNCGGRARMYRHSSMGQIGSRIWTNQVSWIHVKT